MESWGTYKPWSVRPGLTNIPLSKSAETATLTVDSTGEMWIASDVTTTVEVRHSAFPYVSFSAPITLGGMANDDISAITAMPDGEIGVMWSNQKTRLFNFRTNQDGDNPASWSSLETPASQSALKVGHGMADDHMEFAVASDGTLYAAIKTSYDTSGKTKIGLLIRRPSGIWDPIYTVDTQGTRPIVVLDEAIGRLMVVYATATNGGDIVYRETKLDQISFSARGTLIKGHLDNVTSTKQNGTNQILVMAGNGQDKANKAFSALLTLPITDPIPPAAPILLVNAGLDRSIQLPAQAKLHGVVTQQGQPAAPGVITKWTVTSGPGTVTFADDTSLDTAATFSAPGTYVIRLSADDGSQLAFDEFTIVVKPDPTLST